MGSPRQRQEGPKVRALLFTTGSPFARAVRIILDELQLDYEKREEITNTPAIHSSPESGGKPVSRCR